MKSCLFAAVSVLLSLNAWAESPSDQPLVFEPDFFQRFVPQTALDMVERVPGFNLDQGENRRGFAGSASNILIDGRVPVIKGQGMRGFLRRVPAASVARVELIRGSGTSASNAQSVRLNIVLKPGGGSGVWRTTFDYTEDNRVSPSADATWTGRAGRLEYRVSGDYRRWHSLRSGTEDTFDALGALNERVFDDSVRDEDRFGASGEVTAPIGAGELILFGGLESGSSTISETALAFSAINISSGSEFIRSDQDIQTAELSATFSRQFGDWGTEFSALMLVDRAENQQESSEFDAANVLDEKTIEAETSDEFEGILRTVATHGSANANWTFEAELAFNKLDQNLRLTENDGTGPVLVDLPGANTIVEEVRSEVGATRAWDASANWSIEAGLAYEVSRLSNEGDFSDERDLSFWKPSIQVTRKFGDNDQIRLRFYRDIDQLNFEDFAAGVELDNENINAGNADLRPETSWRAELAGDWRFGDGAFEIMIFGWDVEDAQDFALVETDTDRFDTQGNIGAGLVLGLDARLETPLSFIPGSTLTIGGVWQNSEVEDPFTGQTREQSGILESSYELEFRQDVESLSLAWGIEFERELQTPQFRFDRVTQNQDRDRTRIWVETTAFGNLKVRLAADDITGSLQTRDRQRFDPDRLGAFERFERREREQGPSISLRLQGVF